MSNLSVSRIDHELALDAYTNTDRRRAQYERSAQIKRQLAAAISGARLDCRIVEKVQPLFPDCKIHYRHPGNWNENKYLVFYPDASTDHITVYLGKKGEKTIDGAHLLQSADDDAQQAARYAEALKSFWDIFGQYTAIQAYLEQLRPIMSTVMYNTRLY